MRNPYNKVRTGIHSLNSNLNALNNARSNSLNAIVKSVKKLEGMSPEQRRRHEEQAVTNLQKKYIEAEENISKLSKSATEVSKRLSEQRSSLARSGLSSLGNARSATTIRWRPSGGRRKTLRRRRGTRKN